MKPAPLLMLLLVALPVAAQTTPVPPARPVDSASPPTAATLATARQRTLQSLTASSPQKRSTRKSTGGLFGFYSHYISSQDGAPCGFTPSCSAFTQQAVERYGLLRGVLLGIDRLLRDNGAPHGARSPQSGKVVDPVGAYQQAVTGDPP